MMAGWHGGKGSKSRPVNRQKFADNWDAIFGKKTEVKEETIFEVDMGDLPAEDVNDYIEKNKKDIDINNK